jgi:hypothetical protein
MAPSPNHEFHELHEPSCEDGFGVGWANETSQPQRSLAEVRQEANGQAGRLQVVDDLGVFDSANGGLRLQFNQHLASAHEIGTVDGPKLSATVSDWDCRLAFEFDAPVKEGKLDRILVRFLQEPRAHVLVDILEGADDGVAQGGSGFTQHATVESAQAHEAPGSAVGFVEFVEFVVQGRL